LLDLPASIHPLLASGELSAGHARALLGLRVVEDIEALAALIVERGLSVRVTEEEVKRWNRRRELEETQPEEEEEKPAVVNYAKDLENRIMANLGRRVKLDTKRGKSCISFYYEDNEDLESFLRTVVGDTFFDETV
jgi:ParB family chromosome partitioning protein